MATSLTKGVPVRSHGVELTKLARSPVSASAASQLTYAIGLSLLHRGCFPPHYSPVDESARDFSRISAGGNFVGADGERHANVIVSGRAYSCQPRGSSRGERGHREHSLCAALSQAHAHPHTGSRCCRDRVATRIRGGGPDQLDPGLGVDGSPHAAVGADRRHRVPARPGGAAGRLAGRHLSGAWAVLAPVAVDRDARALSGALATAPRDTRESRRRARSRRHR
jgi:hypothetical protein